MNTPYSSGFSQPRARNKGRVPARATSLLLAAILGLSTAPAGHASTLYWDSDAAGTGNATTGVGLGGTGTWNTSLANWWPGSGTTDQAWVNGNNDTAVFGGGVAGTVTLGSGITVGGLFFNTNNYTLATGANTLTFGAANNTITLNNLPAAIITGAVSGTGNVTLTGGALNGSANAGTLTLNGTSTTGWSGTTTVGNGMTLALAGSNQALVSTTGITLNGGGITLTNANVTEGALDRVNNAATITANGGTLTYANTSVATGAYAETLGTVALTSGQLNIISTNAMTSAGTETLTLSGLTQSGTSTVAFGGSGLGGVGTALNKIVVTGLATTAANQIIGPWATIGSSAASQTDYAVNNINFGTGNALGIQGAGIASSVQTAWVNATDTYTQGAAQTLTATRTITALRNTAGTATTQLGANNLETFGLLNGTGTTWTIAASGAGAIRQNGTAAANLYVTTGAGAIAISAPITDNTGALTLVKSGTGGTLNLSGTNTYTGSTIVNAGTLQFAKQVSFYNNNTAGTGWTASNLVVNSGATAAFNVGGTGEFTSSDIDTIKTLGFQSGSSLGLDTTNAGGSFTYANVIADTNSGANVLGLTKLGTGNLTLTNANTYTGPTTINAGTLTLSGGNNRLATTGTVIFSGATGTLDLGTTNQTLAAIVMPSALTSTATILGTGTLTLNGGYIQIGGTTGTQTINMAGLSNFIYDNAAGSFYVGGMANPGNGVLTLAGTNVITAATFGIASNSLISDGGHPGTVHLGQTNTINANTIQIGGTAGSATLDFTSGLTAPTLTIRGTGGSSTDRAAVTVGNSGGFAATTNTLNMGTGVLDAKISTLTIALNTRAGASVPTVTGTFTMGGGTLDATSIIIGQETNSASGTAAVGTFNLNGGTVTAGTLNIGWRSAAGHGGVQGTLNLNSGTLNATTIQQPGTGGTSTFNWADGTIGNITGSNQTVAASIGTFTLTNTGNTSGSHTWSVSGSNTSTVSAILSGNGSLTKTGTGTLTLGAANTYSGDTFVNVGTLTTNVAGKFGTGNVTVFEGASLTFGNNASIGDLATLTFSKNSAAGSINLNFAGVETLGAVYESFVGTYLAAGTYTVGQLNSTLGTSVFTGTGSFTVSAIPEPSTFAALLGSLTLAGVLWQRRRTRG